MFRFKLQNLLFVFADSGALIKAFFAPQHDGFMLPR